MKIIYLDDLRKFTNGIAAKINKQFIAGSNLNSAISIHNTSSTSHEDIRSLISTLTNRLNALTDSDDETLDQLSEIVAYIKNNKDLIEGVTTSKVSVSDIIDSLDSVATNKPLSAKQGEVLKSLISDLSNTVTTSYATVAAVEDLKKSVSDGKTLVADAITEKGIETAADAAFVTMAENIGQITTGGGGGGEDTSDATAIPANVLEDETFYSQSGKQVGTMPNNGSVEIGLLLNETYTIPEGYHDGTGKVRALSWQNAENGTYKFEQNGDRWIANNRGVNSSTATSTWTVTVSEATTAYIGYRTATETADKLSITLNESVVLSATGGNKASETTITLNLVAGENTLVATYTKDGSVHSYGDIAYVILPPIGEQPGQYKYQSKSVTPSTSVQTVYPDTGYDGLYSVSVAAAPEPESITPTSVTITGTLTLSAGATNITTVSGTKNFTITLDIPLSGTKTLASHTISKNGSIGSSAGSSTTVSGSANAKITNISFDSTSSVAAIAEHMGVDLEVAQQMYDTKNVLFELEEDESGTGKVQKILATITESEKSVVQDEKLVVDKLNMEEKL